MPADKPETVNGKKKLQRKDNLIKSQDILICRKI